VRQLDTVVLARALFGTSMAFHIIFATLGVGIPSGTIPGSDR
jgi:cytochrome d ubiquinol oxidase subunit I